MFTAFYFASAFSQTFCVASDGLAGSICIPISLPAPLHRHSTCKKAKNPGNKKRSPEVGAMVMGTQ